MALCYVSGVRRCALSRMFGGRSGTTGTSATYVPRLVMFSEQLLLRGGYLRESCAESVRSICGSCGNVLASGECLVCGPSEHLSVCTRCEFPVGGAKSRPCKSVEAFRKRQLVAFAPTEPLWMMQERAGGPETLFTESALIAQIRARGEEGWRVQAANWSSSKQLREVEKFRSALPVRHRSSPAPTPTSLPPRRAPSPPAPTPRAPAPPPPRSRDPRPAPPAERSTAFPPTTERTPGVPRFLHDLAARLNSVGNGLVQWVRLHGRTVVGIVGGMYIILFLHLYLTRPDPTVGVLTVAYLTASALVVGGFSVAYLVGVLVYAPYRLVQWARSLRCPHCGTRVRVTKSPPRDFVDSSTEFLSHGRVTKSGRLDRRFNNTMTRVTSGRTVTEIQGVCGHQWRVEKPFRRSVDFLAS